MLDLFRFKSGRVFVLDNEAFDLVIGQVACPNDRYVAPSGIADPLLLAIEHPRIAFSFGSRQESTDAPEPTRGSVKANEPIFSRRAMGGSHFCFCSSDPQRKIDPMAKPLWTPKKVAQEESTRAISSAANPASIVLPPAQP